MSYENFAAELIEKVGGKSNIDNVIHCITRLRFYLHDDSNTDESGIQNIPGVIKVIRAQGQFQVVVGTKVGEMYQAILSELDLHKNKSNTSSTADKNNSSPLPAAEKDKNIGFTCRLKQGINQLIGVITGSMIPIIGILSGAGIVKGLLAALVTFQCISDASPVYQLTNTMADSIFYFLPVILGFTAAQKLGANPIVIAVVGGVLIHPTIVGIASGEVAHVLLFGIEFPIMNYVSSVFPILVAAWLGKYIEAILKRIIPAVVSSIIAPIVEIILLSFLVILVVGPSITFVSNGLASGIAALFDFNSIIGGAVYCALFPVLVIFGMHWPLMPMILNDLTVNGFSTMNAFSSVLMMGIAGAAFAVALKSKKQSLKQLGFAATLSQICGVGEPALYGILLKYKRVFYVVTFANIVGGALAGALHLVNYGFAGALVGFASFINPASGIDSNFYNYLITHFGTLVLSFVLTWIIGYHDQMKATDEGGVRA